jgi:glutamate racemase
MIGIFDSGIGGLTVVRELMRQKPDASFIYLGDTARTPYGNKSPETVLRYAIEDVEFLLAHGATSIVIACNTASAIAEEQLMRAYPHIPVFGVIRPAIEEALSLKPYSIGVIGTRATVSSGIYQKMLQEAGTSIAVRAQACPLFTSLVEEGLLEDQVTKLMIKKYLSEFRAHRVDAMILGCTHYPLLRPQIARYVGKKTELVDPAAAVIRKVLSDTRVPPAAGEQQFFLTDVAPHTVAIASKWLGKGIHVEKAQVGTA